MEKLTWSTEKRRIRDLIPASYNPRRLTEQQAKDLRKSLERFDLVEIPAIDTDGTILAGHQRLGMLVSMGRGDEDVDVRVPNRKLTDSEAKEYNLRSNKNTGEWDMDKLFEMPKELLEDVGFDEKEIQKLIDSHTEVSEDDYDVEEGLKTPVRCERGEIWQLGSHRLMCGDSTDKEDVERLMDGKEADMVFTDPPYGIGIARNPIRQVHEKKSWDDKPIDKQLCDFLITLAEKVIIWGGNYFELPPSQGFLIWDKKQPEDFSLAMCEQAWTNVQIPAKVWRQSVTNYKKEHPTQKPVELISWSIGIVGGAKHVLDLFGGSGSTLIACEQTGRTCYMMEIDPKYCTVILNRWEKLTGKQAVKLYGST